MESRAARLAVRRFRGARYDMKRLIATIVDIARVPDAGAGGDSWSRS